ncbi:MAG: 50S ribosomal protein L13 [Candidatus Liptonbacteria bacterium RIFCSPHIGHO2_01_FULL_57_28]|uniref:Large ribosomal subunit protein uL13 n=1 Tax=Candidatus Liptonbacteria bacterium RIFCSPHIGHO2_01_FULL_57_28 TaxID=1798647 RepID=A0A1G2CA99_9BACT|nr:MAG: 50S ribosomal protein L13 [Candidatus Liptonbacteria bacterium RIFCSPHIGHO2_01_FULL_57_28]
MADYTIDAKGKRLGRLATEIAGILQGKKNANYAPNKAGDDRVLVKNVDKIVWTGQKGDQRVYYRHTGYMGHVKEQTLAERKAKDPKKMLRETVRHMLPKNFLNTPRMKNMVFIEKDGN